MKIYVAHSIHYNDFKNKLYKPLRNSKLSNNHELIFPHMESTKTLYNSKEELKTTQVVIAEVSIDSMGVGIELGWASLYGNKIICICKRGRKLSSSLRAVSGTIVWYDNEDELISSLEYLLQ